MQEITKVTLENEMDLILAHKRTMKLAEVAGLSLSAQTTFATAVSEVSRNIIESKKSGYLVLCVKNEQHDQYIVACLKDESPRSGRAGDGLEYAKRLVNKYNISTKGSQTSIELFYYIQPNFKIDILKLDEWRQLFRNEPPISPYDELKRKNEQLQDLSDKFQKSEQQYRTLTNSLPLTIFSLDLEGKLLYANEWLFNYTGYTSAELNQTNWASVVHEEDYGTFSLLLKNDITHGTSVARTQARIRNNSGEFIWHQISLSPFINEKNELLYWIGYIVDIHAQKVVEETLKDNIELKHAQEQLHENQQSLERTINELNRSNLELQQFAYVASHDLQEPVRKLLFYSDYLLNNCRTAIDEKGAFFLESMHASSKRMRKLIQDVLAFSQIDKEKVDFKDVDLNETLAVSCQDLEMYISEKKAVLEIGPLPIVRGDGRMLQQVFENIIGNSIKYAKEGTEPHIKITHEEQPGYHVISFRDNGIGFDEQYLPQLFTLFKRLHNRETYQGTGLGLAICKKIMEMHEGSIEAASDGKSGATFSIAFPVIHLTN